MAETFSEMDRLQQGRRRVLLYFLGLNSVIEDKARSANVPTIHLNMRGADAGEEKGEDSEESKESDMEDEEEAEKTDKSNEKINVDMKMTLEDIKAGKVQIIVMHAETLDAENVAVMLNYLVDNDLVSGVFIDEWQKNLHWKPFRPRMYSLVPRLLLQVKAPVVLATATILPTEVEFAKKTWCMENTVSLTASPVQPQHFLVKLRRPATNNGFWGKSRKVGGEKRPGIIDSLAFFLDPYCEMLAAGEEPESSTIIFFPNKEMIGELDKYLSLRLPDVPYYPDVSPWVMFHGSMDDCTMQDIYNRRGKGISLWAASNILELGVNLPRVDRVIMVSPYGRPHELLQCVGRTGRPDGEGVVRKSICYIMFNNHDMASKIISTEVKDFLKSDQCLKKSLAAIFGFDWQGGDASWCCNVCSGFSNDPNAVSETESDGEEEEVTEIVF